MENWVKVLANTELMNNNCAAVSVGDLEIGIFRVNDQLFAVSNTCTHIGAPLTEGYIEGMDVMCPWHGAKFCLKTGASRGAPAETDLVSYPVRLIEGDIQIKID